MATADAFFLGNDMLVRLDLLKSSTMASGTYLNNSGGVSMVLWSALSTADASKFVITKTLTYVTASNGRYQCAVQSTEHSMAKGTQGMAVISVVNGALNGEWRSTFLVGYRRKV